jgi:hypothetical protein
MLSTEFWRNFLPAGKDFTIPASNFLPAGIPFSVSAKQRQEVRGYAENYAQPARITPSLTSLRSGHQMPLPSSLTTDRNRHKTCLRLRRCSKAASGRRSPRCLRHFHSTCAHRSLAAGGRQGGNNSKAETAARKRTALSLRRGHRLSRAALRPRVFDRFCSRSE